MNESWLLECIYLAGNHRTSFVNSKCGYYRSAGSNLLQEPSLHLQQVHAIPWAGGRHRLHGQRYSLLRQDFMLGKLFPTRTRMKRCSAGTSSSFLCSAGTESCALKCCFA